MGGQDVVFKDIIEPLESVSVSLTPTEKDDITLFGAPEEARFILLAPAPAPCLGGLSVLGSLGLACATIDVIGSGIVARSNAAANSGFLYVGNPGAAGHPSRKTVHLPDVPVSSVVLSN